MNFCHCACPAKCLDVNLSGLIHGAGLTCADEFEVGPNIPSAPYMKLFAKNETAWLTTFVKAWKHATENGQEGRLFSTCSATPVVPTTNSELEQASLLNLQ